MSAAPLLCISILHLVVSIGSAAGAPTIAIQGRLDSGELREATLDPASGHAWEVEMKAGSFVELEIQQQWIDVAIRLVDPNEVTKMEQDLSRMGGVEKVLWISDLAGTWRAEILPSEGIKPGTYTVQILLNREARPTDSQLVTAQSMSNRARELWKAAQYSAAESLYVEVLHIRERILGAASRDVASTLNSLAAASMVRRQYAEAESLCMRALEIRETSLGRDHPEVATSLTTLAILFNNQRLFDKGKPLLDRALAIRESVFGPDHLLVALSLTDLATYHRRQGQYGEAEPLYQRALAIEEQLLGPDHSDIGSLLENLATVYKEQARYEDAEPLYRRALEIQERASGSEHPRVATLLNNIGILCYQLGRYDEAESFYRRALAIFETTSGPDHPNVASAVNNLAAVKFDQGQYGEAELLYRRALEISEKTLGPDHANVAICLSNVGNVYQAQGHFADAVPLYQRALAIAEKSAGPEDRNVATTLNNLASLYFKLDQPQLAEPMFRRALEIWEGLLGPDHPDVASSVSNLANVLQDQGRLAEAEPLYRRALQIREDALRPDHPDVAQSLNNLAVFYQDQRRDEQSEAMYRRALAITERVFGPEHSDVAQTLNNLGNLCFDAGRYGEAEPLYRRALQIWEHAQGLEGIDVAMGASNLGNLYMSEGKHKEAAALFNRALDIQKHALGPVHGQLATSHMRLAELSLVRGDKRLDAALRGIETAIQILDTTPTLPWSRVEAYTLKARILHKSGNAEKAIASLSEALRSAEELRPGVGGGEQTRAAFFERFSESFDYMVSWQVRAHHLPEALEYGERHRARVLLDQLAAGRIDLRTSIPADVRAALEGREASAKARLAEAQLARTLLYSRHDLSQAEMKSQQGMLDQSLASASIEFQRVYEEIKNASPLWRDQITSGGQPLELATLQRQLVPANGLILMYHIGAVQSFLFVIPEWGQEPQAIELEVTATVARQLHLQPGPLQSQPLSELLFGGGKAGTAFGLVSQLSTTTRGVSVEPPKEQLHQKEALHALWGLLVPEEMWTRIVSCEALVVIPDGALNYLPFEALVVGLEGGDRIPRYWLDAGPPIRYAASATTLYNVTRRPMTRTSRRATDPTVLSLSDPLYNAEDVEIALRGVGATASSAAQSSAAEPEVALAQDVTRDLYSGLGGTLGRLPGTALETQTIRQAFTKHLSEESVVSLSQLEATEEQLRARLPNVPFVHLATHGLADEKRGALFAALALTPKITQPAVAENDGFLQLHEIYDLKLPDCELAVLSGCQTNIGPRVSGEGVFALSRGFLVAGARRVVASLWNVDDESTARLIGEFFEQIAVSNKEARTIDYTLALRDAKRSIRSQDKWSAPAHWAAFVLTGKQ